MNARPHALALAALALLAAPALPAAVVSFPYHNDFTSSVADFNAGGGGTWALSTTAGTYTNTITSGTTFSSRVVQVPGFLAPKTGGQFQVQTSFNVNSFVGNNTTVGFAALGGDSALSTPYYLADVQLGNAGGNLRLFRINPTVSLTQGNWGGTIATGADYTLTLTGTYAANGDLNLLLALSDGTTTGSISSTVLAADVIQGQNFGLRNRTDGGTGRLNVAHSYLSITPEPSRPLLLATALTPLLLRRRKRP